MAFALSNQFTVGPLGVPAWASALVTDRWATLGGNFMRDGRTPGEVVSTHERVYTAWNGTGYDPIRRLLFKMLAGGHTDRHDNDVLQFNLGQNSPLWSQRKGPSAGVSPGDGQEFSGKYGDGQPRATHTADNTVYGGGRWVQIGMGACSVSGAGSYRIWQFDPDTNTFIDRGQMPVAASDDTTGFNNRAFSTAVYDAALDVFWYVPTGSDNGRGLYRINPNVVDSNGFWQVTTFTPNASTGLDACAFIDPRTHMLVTFGGRALSPIHGVRAIELDNINAGWFQPTITGTAPGTSGKVKLHWHAARNKAVGWHNSGANLFTLAPPALSPRTNSWTWGSAAPAAGNTIVPPNVPAAINGSGMYSNVQYIPDIGDGRAAILAICNYTQSGSTPEVYIRALGNI